MVTGLKRSAVRARHLEARAERKKFRTDVDPKPNLFLIDATNQVSYVCGTQLLEAGPPVWHVLSERGRGLASQTSRDERRILLSSELEELELPN